MFDKRNLADSIAWSYLGTPYCWGGDDPMAGFDCSGFIVELLKSVGILPHKGDWTAHALFKRFKRKEVTHPKKGCLVFWGTASGRMTHIELCIDKQFCIGASGGGSKTDSLADAIQQNAYIKVRPIDYRGMPKAFVDPFL